MGIPSLVNEKTATIVNAALFFEHILTSTSWSWKNGKTGVDIWNREYPDLPTDFEDEINVVMNYRHKIVHDTAESARKKLEQWQEKYRVSDKEVLGRVQEIAISNAKNITREIIKDYKKYEYYRNKLPK